MSSSFAARIAARFSLLDFTNVYGFPNTIPDMNIWADILPKFGEDEDDNPGRHLFEFHKLMEELNVHHKDVLMKMFMFTLGKDARLWYKYLTHSSIPSLKCFHALFHQHCRRIYPAEILFEDCCNTCPLKEEERIEISQVDEDDQYEEGHPLNNSIAASTHTDLQPSHSPRYECQISSSSEDVNMFLNGDTQVFHGILQQVNEPICDDFLSKDQILDSALFHEK
jgi:hypothetical protein